MDRTFAKLCPQISIIMPLYNAERYLEEALICIIQQTFTDYELICINDASIDSTLQILEAFQAKDGRIKIYSNPERKGAAFSRNRGMEIASGKYLSFLDGDDIFDEQMLEKAYHIAELKNADITMFEFKHVPSELIHNKLSVQHSKEFIDRYCKDTFAVQNYEPYEFLKWSSAAWNKLYRKEFIDRHQLVFQDLPSSNDCCFVNLSLLLSEKTIFVEDKKMLLYIRDHDVPTRISCHRDPKCTYYACIKVYDELVKREKFESVYQHYYIRLFMQIQAIFFGLIKEEQKEAFYDFLKNDGIARIRSMGGEYYNKMDGYIRHLLEQFEEQEYGSQWYLKFNLFEIHLHLREEKIVALFQKYASKNAMIGVWGAGMIGKALLAFCAQHNLHIEAVIDKAIGKRGSIVGFHDVMLPEECWDKVQVIIVAAKSIYEEVVRDVGQRKIEVIDLGKEIGIFW